MGQRVVPPRAGAPSTPPSPAPEATVPLPLAWPLAGVIGGYALAWHGWLLWWPLAVGWGVAAACGALAAGPTHRTARGALTLLAALLLAQAWWPARWVPTPPGWEGLPPRAVTLSVEVETVYRSGDQGGFASGLVKIVAAPPLLADVSGQTATLQLQLPEAAWLSTAAENTGAPGVPGALPGMRLRLERTARWEVFGLLEPIAPTGAAGNFLDAAWAYGVRFAIRRAEPTRLVVPAHPFFRHTTELGDHLAKALLPYGELGQVLRVMLLGQREYLSPERRALYQQSGAMHVLAVSGLHITALAAGLVLLGRGLGLSTGAATFCALPLLWWFVEFSGASPSAWRAFWLAAIVGLAPLLRRQSHPANALAAAALGVILHDPRALWSASFQLSYAIVAALLLYGRPFQDALDRLWQSLWLAAIPAFAAPPDKSLAGALAPVHVQAARWPIWLRELGRGLAVALVASVVATLPAAVLTVGLFQQIAAGGVVMNLVLVPLSTFQLLLGFGGLLTYGLGWGPVADLLLTLGAMLTWWSEWVMAAGLAVPGAVVRVGWVHPAVGPVALLAMLACMALAATGTGRARRWGLAGPWLILLLMLPALGPA